MMEEDELARRLPAMLTDEPMPASTVDLGQAIRTGRRRRSIRYVASGVAALAVIAAVPIALQSQRPQAPPLSLPPTPPPSSSPVAAVNPTVCSVAQSPAGFLTLNTDPGGRYFAGTFTENKSAVLEDNSAHKPALWKDGRLELIPLEAGQYGYADAVNSSGVVIGRLIDGAGVVSLFAYAQGKVHLLPEGQDARAIAINEAGVIVGARQVGGEWLPVRWRSLSSPPEVLPLPAGSKGGTASAIAPDGLTFGNVIFGNEAGQTAAAYVWTAEGNGSAIPSPGGLSYQLIGGSGDWIHGYYLEGKEETTRGALLYNLRTQEFRRIPGYSIDGETSATSNGWFAARRGNTRDQVFLGDGSTFVPLPLPVGVSRVLLDSVSLDATVVTGHRTDDKRAGVIWHCK